MPAAVAIDAAGGFAYPALERAVERLADIAPRLGIAIDGVRRSHHCGVAGVPVEALAQRGLVGLMMANSPPAMAPWGGDRALTGTNPIAFAAPVPGREPLVVDVSLSKVARGRIMASSQKGEAIPEGWAFGPDGAPTTDPKAALAGFMAPLGEAKGTALALMVELIAAGLTGANYAYEASSFFDAEGPPPGVGQTLIAIDPRVFGRDDAIARFGEMAHAVASTAGARLPGDRRRELRERLSRDGIPVDDALLGELRALAA
jgi:(2R)-3-sulfolactate dehydrogenase (NADP+)